VSERAHTKSIANALRRPFATALIVIIAWFGVTGYFGPLFGKLTSVQKNNNSAFLPDSAEATRAVKVIEKFSSGESTAFPTLILFEGRVSPEILQQISAYLLTIGDLKLGGTQERLSQFLDKNLQAVAFPAEDNSAILASIPLDGNAITQILSNDEPALPAIIEALREDFTPFAQELGLTSYVTGAGGLIGDLFGSFGSLDSTLLLTTLSVVALILIVVYRSPVLWILPLISAVFALATGGGMIYLLAKNNVIDVNGQSQGILSVLVLGAATDYALLLISRYREELHHYASRFDAMRATYKGVFEPILASGSTVAVSLMVLLLSDLSGNRGLGPIGAIGVVASVITILTLLPALLVAFGRWIFWPRIPRFDDVDSQLTGTWAKVGRVVEKRPRKLWIASTLLLLIFAGFSTTLKATGLSTADSFTGNPESVVGQKLLLTHFPGGEGDPTKVIVKPADVDKASAALAQIKGVSSVEPDYGFTIRPGQTLPPIKVVDGLTILNVTLDQAPDSVEARRYIPEIRSVLREIDPNILVGGTTAVYYDTDVASRHDNNTVIPVVLLLITIILGLLLRSILSAILLLGTVVLSYFATLGVCALVFNHIFGFAGGDTSFPLFAFIFLVALGIDYNIFLMTRVREESANIGTRKGVIKGLTATGSVITSAGVVLAATFGVLGILPLVFLAELGFAVAFGVLLDTILVRSILVPALVHDIGPKVWWPSKLQSK
jgi:putative drug exporter of the RND superfamily